MGTKRKKASEASGDVAVALTVEASTGRSQKRRMVAVGLSLSAKRERLGQEAPQYRSASAAQKKELLDAFPRSTGYHRKYAMWLLNHPKY